MLSLSLLRWATLKKWLFREAYAGPVGDKCLASDLHVQLSLSVVRGSRPRDQVGGVHVITATRPCHQVVLGEAFYQFLFHSAWGQLLGVYLVHELPSSLTAKGQGLWFLACFFSFAFWVLEQTFQVLLVLRVTACVPGSQSKQFLLKGFNSDNSLLIVLSIQNFKYKI